MQSERDDTKNNLMPAVKHRAQSFAAAGSGKLFEKNTFA